MTLAEQPGAVTDPVRVTVSKRLEDRLRAVVLARVYGLAEKVFVRELVGGLVILSRETTLLPREVKADDREPFLVAGSVDPGFRCIRTKPSSMTASSSWGRITPRSSG